MDSFRLTADNCFTVTLLSAEMAGDTSTQRRAVCGKITYDPSDKLCCGGAVQSMWPSADMFWPKCCGTKVYDAGYNLCCRGVVHRKKEGKCCGTQVYDEQYYSCCHSSVGEKSWICWVAYHFVIGHFSQSHDPTVKNEEKNRLESRRVGHL